MTRVVEITPEQFVEANFLPLFEERARLSPCVGEFNPRHFFATWQQQMRSGIARTWATVERTAIAGAVFGPNLFTAVPTAAVVFWASLPDSGSDADLVRDAVEQAAREKSCLALYGSIRASSGRMPAMRRKYRMRGYKLAEEHYVKV